MTIEEWLNKDELAITIWNNKYRFENESLDAWFKRVSNNNPEVEKLIREKKFIFGGRILANRGLNSKNKKITYSNCYVIAPPQDNLESIFECGSKLARTFSYGGGCGIDISNLRPTGSKVNNAAKTTSGAVSFMDFYSYITGLIGQSGRRGEGHPSHHPGGSFHRRRSPSLLPAPPPAGLAHPPSSRARIRSRG